MIVDKRLRYFRRYKATWKGRKKAAPPLPLVTTSGPNSIVAALRHAMRNDRASAMAGFDTVDLIKVEHLQAKKVVVLLFHRVSPTAADPAYRRKTKAGIELRQTAKNLDEDQAVSSHLIISTERSADGTYGAVLEEVPGLSASLVMSIVGRVLNDFQYPYTDKKQELETNTVIRFMGVKSETLDEALKKKSALRYLTLVRTKPADAPDSEGIAEPQSERVRYKIVGDPTTTKWKNKFKEFVEGTSGTWEEVSIVIDLDDERSRTVKIDRSNEAAEITFTRSEQVSFPRDLSPCSTTVVNPIVEAATKLLPKD